jgi:hypothetical protein
MKVTPIARLRTSFADLKGGKPGRRFRDYHSRKYDGATNWILIAAGWALILAGALLSLVPGIPGIVLAIPGAALLSAESRFCAGALDWLELRLRRLLASLSTGKKEAARRRLR